MTGDIFERYEGLFRAEVDGDDDAFLFSEEPYDIEALRRTVRVTGIRMNDLGILRDLMKAHVRWHEDCHKAESIEGDYEDMAVFFAKSIGDKLNAPRDWQERVTAAYGRFSYDGADKMFMSKEDGSLVSPDDHRRRIDEELNVEVELHLNLSELHFLFGTLQQRVVGDRRALTFWDEEADEPKAERLLDIVHPFEGEAHLIGCQSIYDFVC